MRVITSHKVTRIFHHFQINMAKVTKSVKIYAILLNLNKEIRFFDKKSVTLHAFP